MTLDDKKKFLINFLYIGSIILIVYLSIKYVLPLFLPFLIGFAIAMLLKPIVQLLTKKLKLKPSLAATIVLILFYGIICGLLTLLCIRLVISLQDVFFNLPEIYSTNIQPAIDTILNSITKMVEGIDPKLVAQVSAMQIDISSTFSSIISAISSGAVKMITGLATSIPSMLVAFLFTIVSSFFITIDYRKITSYATRHMGVRVREILFAIKKSLSRTVFRFIKAYAILMTVTFVELAIGLLILGVENAVGVAFLIALIDILPVLGTGGVVIPWILIEFVNGNISFAIGLTIVYVIITVIRNIIEPKVVGDQIGLYPLVTLMAMFIGARLFGVVGLLGLPIAITILKDLQDQGVIEIYKKE